MALEGLLEDEVETRLIRIIPGAEVPPVLDEYHAANPPPQGRGHLFMDLPRLLVPPIVPSGLAGSGSGQGDGERNKGARRPSDDDVPLRRSSRRTVAKVSETRAGASGEVSPGAQVGALARFAQASPAASEFAFIALLVVVTIAPGPLVFGSENLSRKGGLLPSGKARWKLDDSPIDQSASGLLLMRWLWPQLPGWWLQPTLLLLREWRSNLLRWPW